MTASGFLRVLTASTVSAEPQIDKAALLQAGIQLLESKKGKKEELLQLTPVFHASSSKLFNPRTISLCWHLSYCYLDMQPAGPPPEVLPAVVQTPPELVLAPPPLLLTPPAIPPTEISGAVSGAAGR